MLEYLSRRTHRTAIGNERIRAVSEREVAFTVRADDRGANCSAKRLVRMQLPAARLALQMPAPNPQAMESAQAFLVRVVKMHVGLCPCCKVGSLRVAASLTGLPCLPTPGSSGLPVCRGPP